MITRYFVFIIFKENYPMKICFLFILFGIIGRGAFPQATIYKDFKNHFDMHDVKGCFILHDQSDKKYIMYNPDLCDSGYIPVSTFKIPHAVIALEEKLISDKDQVIKWNGHQWPHDAWNQDQTLETAMKFSCIWVFFKFAEELGIEKYYHHVNEFDYGNKDLTGPPTRFWLSGSFRISAKEQIEFLEKLYNYDLPVSKSSIDIVKDIIVLEHTDKYKLSGKTGSGVLKDNEYIMWLVGYLEKAGEVYFYAMNFKTNDYDKTKNARYEITKSIFTELNLLE